MIVSLLTNCPFHKTLKKERKLKQESLLKKMATVEKVEFENKNQDLKHLGFVRVAAIRALVCVSNLYGYAKQNSGPLRSTVGIVEGAVTSVVGPVYKKFRGVPDHLLGFLDKKVDDASHKFDDRVPAAAKQAISRAQDLVHKTAQNAKKLVDEARTKGPRGALHYAAAEYKQFVLVNSTKLWVKLNHNSAFHSVAEMVVPTAANLSGKYNGLVKDLSGKGYPLFGYLPLIPVDEFGEAVKQAEAKEKEHMEAHKTDSGSGSDSD